MIPWPLPPDQQFFALVVLVTAYGMAGWILYARGEDTRDILSEIDEDVEQHDTDIRRLDTDMDALWAHVDELRDLVRLLAGESLPDDVSTDQFEIPYEGEPTEEHPAVTPDDDGPSTDIAHPADTWARKLGLLQRKPSEGRHHHGEGGGRTVPELLAEAGLEPL